MTRTITTIAALAALTVLSTFGFNATASAQEMPSAEAAYADIAKVYGTVPTFMKHYPKQAIAGAWAMTKGLEIEPGALDAKTKSLISIAVAAQIPCRYCVWADSKLAKDRGATDAEIAEAVAQAGMTRNWSTVLNGMQIDFEQFQVELGGD